MICIDDPPKQASELRSFVCWRYRHELRIIAILLKQPTIALFQRREDFFRIVASWSQAGWEHLTHDEQRHPSL